MTKSQCSPPNATKCLLPSGGHIEVLLLSDSCTPSPPHTHISM